ncbi:MAG: Ni/Fe hydrogenase subunit alpha [Candidatus Obscuribacterales bacterium]|nr:Ni/Fe hydrogenase subunit alpha [Candidatus Obscuribacterales bacterium]
MSESEQKVIQIPEICRVEGHAAVNIEIKDGKVSAVKLDVFEGTRFFERIVLAHKYDEVAHIGSRVCAICSAGHVLAAIFSIEKIFAFKASAIELLYRELLHLGMIIESHATHICALALPDFLKTPQLHDFAENHPNEFSIWLNLRKLGAAIQTTVGGRPFHPVNMHVGSMSRYPEHEELKTLQTEIDACRDEASTLCNLLLGLTMPLSKTAEPNYLALIPHGESYGYFGDTVRSSEGWESSVSEYKTYLSETAVPGTHAKRTVGNGKPYMVGSLARLYFFSERLGDRARSIYEESPLARGQSNTILNNLAQGIELVEAMDRSNQIINQLLKMERGKKLKAGDFVPADMSGAGVGAVECPRGTLYHYYELDSAGLVKAADMLTPSAQNTARIEQDITCVVEHGLETNSPVLNEDLETLVRAYDPCNTCATHYVSVKVLD